ncbi:MAG TPA: cache domain-containing protein, partial [Povalibacter sp.]|nr:cache domain-containing protein [Povalibacter sp.]
MQALAAGDAGSRSRSRISYIIATVLAMLIVGGVAYYGLNVIRASTFGKERAFRVLGEVAEQIQNLQGNLVGLLGNVPDRLKQCDGPDCARGRAQFARKLDLKLQLQSISVKHSVFDAVCSVNDKATAFVVHANEPNLPFKLFSCSASATAESPAAESSASAPDAMLRLSYGLTGELTPSAEEFISQAFFDEVIVALDDGRVVAEVPNRQRSLAPGSILLHESKVRLLSVTDATQLLRRAAAEASNPGAASLPTGKADADTPISLHPVVFSDRLAGQAYNAFVVGVRLSYPTIAVDGSTQQAGQHALYVIGLKHADLRADILGALGPSGTFIVTVIIALIFFCFPLLSLRLKPMRDPISWPEAASCLLSLILLAALAAVTTAWLWSQQELVRWADGGMRAYAEEIRRRLIDELGNDAVVLSGYRDEIFRDVQRSREDSPDRGCWESFSTEPLPLRALPPPEPPAVASARFVWPPVQTGSGELPASPRKWSAGDDSCNTLQLRAHDATDGLKSWSPLRSSFVLLADGKAAGPRVTAYAIVPVKRDTELKDRPYFKALERDGQWHLPLKGEQGQTLEFVAQRLFNRGDGARVLQVAVPRRKDGAFDGLVSGDTRAHGLTAAVAPLFLKFAVIDRDGAVLFHWDDSRSVTENFLVEAERNSMLQSAVAREQPGYFDGNYNGTPHRFYYLPLEGVPWGVVAFYPTSSVLELSAQAGISALVAYAAIILLAVAVFVLITVIIGRTAMKQWVSTLWPRPQAQHSYEMWGVAGTISTVGFMMVLAWPNGEAGRMIAAAVVMIIGAVLLLASRYWRGHAYPMCISVLLVFTAAVPAAWLSLRYHDAQIEALVRGGLANALDDIERRHAVIAHDLRRWQPDPGARERDLPDAWTLAEHPHAMPVAGYQLGGGQHPSPESQSLWSMTAFAAPPWVSPRPTPELNRWLQYIWRETASTVEQQQRSGILHDSRTIGNWDLVTSDGRPIAVRAQWRAPRSDDTDLNSLPWFKDVMAMLVALVAILLSSSLVCRRLLGAHVVWPAKYSGRDVLPESPATVIYFQGAAKATIDDVLARVTQTINLATDARFASSQALDVAAGTYLLEELDLAVIEPARRQQILTVLEQLIDRDDVELIITANRSPLRRLHRPWMYPEFSPGDEPGYAELIRWDRAMATFREVLQPAVPPTQAGLPTARLADFHRTWKLCTRDERLLLHQLATGKL